MKRLNKKGFTLVELLAVIVVLAFIMVLAAPSVLSSMNSARQSSFMLYAEKMINAAQSKYQADSLIQTMSQEVCYSLQELSDSKSTQYAGFVHITGGASQNAEYKIQMLDKIYTLGLVSEATAFGDKPGGVTFNDIELIKTKLNKDTNLTANSTNQTTVQSPCTNDNRTSSLETSATSSSAA